MDALTILFDSATRVKLLRLFLMNETESFDLPTIKKRCMVRIDETRRVLRGLEKAGFIKQKQWTVSVTTKTGRSRSKKISGWIAVSTFPLREQLKALLIETGMIRAKEVQQRFAGSSHGSIKLLVLSGIFVHNTDHQVDVIIVGDKLDQKRIQSTVQGIEAEIGKELRYTVFTPEEFAYRMNMFDKYLLDIFQSDHERLIEKIPIPNP